MESIDIKYNLVRGFQDAIQINAGGTGGVDIAYNVFENMGEDNAPTTSAPTCIYFLNNKITKMHYYHKMQILWELL